MRAFLLCVLVFKCDMLINPLVRSIAYPLRFTKLMPDMVQLVTDRPTNNCKQRIKHICYGQYSIHQSTAITSTPSAFTVLAISAPNSEPATVPIVSHVVLLSKNVFNLLPMPLPLINKMPIMICFVIAFCNLLHCHKAHP